MRRGGRVQDVRPALIVLGGLASLVAAADGRRARLAVYLGPISLLAGVGALPLSMGLPVLCEQVLGLRALEGLAFFGGYGVGVLGGAALGLRRALSIQRRIESEAHD
jgi:hypothetical protein